MLACSYQSDGPFCIDNRGVTGTFLVGNLNGTWQITGAKIVQN